MQGALGALGVLGALGTGVPTGKKESPNDPPKGERLAMGVLKPFAAAKGVQPANVGTGLSARRLSGKSFMGEGSDASFRGAFVKHPVWSM